MSLRNSVIDAVFSSLHMPFVYLNRTIAVTREEVEQGIVTNVQQGTETARNMGDVVSRELKITITAYARGDDSSQELGEHFSRIYAFMLADPMLLGLVGDINEESVDFRFDQADLDSGVQTTVYRIIYLTRKDDMEFQP